MIGRRRNATRVRPSNERRLREKSSLDCCLPCSGRSVVCWKLGRDDEVGETMPSQILLSHSPLEHHHWSLVTGQQPSRPEAVAGVQRTMEPLHGPTDVAEGAARHLASTRFLLHAPYRFFSFSFSFHSRKLVTKIRIFLEADRPLQIRLGV